MIQLHRRFWIRFTVDGAKCRAGAPHQVAVELRCVRAAIGHADDGVAEAHYDDLDPTEASPAATWDRKAGENFSDLFERLCPEPNAQKSHQKSHHQGAAERKASMSRGWWRSQRESNPLARKRKPSE